MRIDRSIKSMDQLPSGFEPPSLGTAEAVRASILESFPQTDWSDPAWGIFDSPDFALEFSIRQESPVDSFMVHVHGSGDPVSPLLEMCKRHEWQAFDTSKGDLIDLDNPATSAWQDFQEWRDRVLREME